MVYADLLSPQQRKSTVQNRFDQQPSVEARIPCLTRCLGDQQAGMTGSTLQRIIVAAIAVLGADGVVGAKRKASCCARQQFACALRHIAQAAECSLPACSRGINQDSEAIRLRGTTGVDTLLQRRERIAAFKGELRHEGMGHKERHSFRLRMMIEPSQTNPDAGHAIIDCISWIA